MIERLNNLYEINKNENNYKINDNLFESKTNDLFDIQLNFAKISLNENLDKNVKQIENKSKTDFRPKREYKTKLFNKKQLINNKSNEEFKCDFNDCNKKFKYKHNLITHKNVVHSEDKAIQM